MASTKKPKPAAAKPADPTAALHAVLDSMKLPAIRAALEAGANANILVADTPALTLALYRAKFDVAQALFDHGADVDFDDGAGTLLAGLCDNEGEKIPKPDATAAMWLIKHGADCKRATRESGRTPLADAARSGHLELVNGLLGGGASLGPDKPTGNTPLHWAVASRADRMIWQRLLAAGNKLEAKNLAGETPLSLAQAAFNHDAVAFLIEKGAKRDLTVGGKTPVERATALKQTKIVKLLSR
ncbi:MAG TPA: ankyrin repeat domain-containing protein [Kofleriaceae bacterium]